jgi:hypothetical protein
MTPPCRSARATFREIGMPRLVIRSRPRRRCGPRPFVQAEAESEPAGCALARRACLSPGLLVRLEGLLPYWVVFLCSAALLKTASQAGGRSTRRAQISCRVSVNRRRRGPFPGKTIRPALPENETDLENLVGLLATGIRSPIARAVQGGCGDARTRAPASGLWDPPPP